MDDQRRINKQEEREKGVTKSVIKDTLMIIVYIILFFVFMIFGGFVARLLDALFSG